jgi:hypothetical protein
LIYKTDTTTSWKHSAQSGARRRRQDLPPAVSSLLARIAQRKKLPNAEI